MKVVQFLPIWKKLASCIHNFRNCNWICIYLFISPTPIIRKLHWILHFHFSCQNKLWKRCRFRLLIWIFWSFPIFFYRDWVLLESVLYLSCLVILLSWQTHTCWTQLLKVLWQGKKNTGHNINVSHLKTQIKSCSQGLDWC